MQYHPFHTGDRVVTKKSVAGVPAGRAGTVILAFLSIPNCYDIHFDENQTSRVIFGSDLDLIQTVRDASPGKALEE